MRRAEFRLRLVSDGRLAQQRVNDLNGPAVVCIVIGGAWQSEGLESSSLQTRRTLPMPVCVLYRTVMRRNVRQRVSRAKPDAITARPELKRAANSANAARDLVV